MKDYRKLKVWEKAHGFVISVYEVTSGFSSDEKFGLTSQLRRAAVSIPSNIAEGCGRGNDGDLRRFCEISMGSVAEVEYQVLLAHDLKMIIRVTFERLNAEIVEVKRMLHGFITTLRNGGSQG